ncbi:MAG TPA: hypothetical protein VFE15_00475 [Marmoricola sp.]|jgi:hypothetical protein|nr:hypothetical protein [Marmoricola sp.]
MSLASGIIAAIISGAVVGHPVFRFTDPTITEASALIDLGPLMVTTNDSGGGPFVYVVDARTGATVGRTTYTTSVVDTEALAPAGLHAVWVGDIGDNDAVRSSVQVYRVPVGRGDRTVHATRYNLVYPGGPRDAESLLVGRDGRLRIISKGILGGSAYLAPKHLDPDHPNRLRRIASIGIFATDAALFPDGKHVLIRGYDNAIIDTFPGFREIAEVSLPYQQQGEGVSIGRTGRIRLSSEGVHSPVLQVRLPANVEARLHPVVRSTAPTVVEDAGDNGSALPGGRWTWLGAGGLAVLLGGRLVLGARRRRQQ